MRRFSLLVSLLVACGEPSTPGDAGSDATRPDAGALRPGVAWPEADSLFHRDPRWLGADAAYSIALGGERVLWLFGDTFVATSEAHVRTASRLVRNTVALEEGLCPTTASITFHWREAPDGTPESFVPEHGEIWRWPLHGIALDGALTMFFLREARSMGPLGFETVGWEAFRVADPSGTPDGWTLEPLEVFASAFPVAVGVSVVEDGDHVLAYAVEEPGAHDVYLLRWTRADFVAGDLATPEWWSEDGWTPHDPTAGAPPPIFEAGATELSVSRTPGGGAVVVQSVGFGATTIGVRLADAFDEPFGRATSVFRPPESDRDGVFVYAGKGHPELVCPGEDPALVVTYAANATAFDVLLSDTSLYYPRVVRVPWP